LKTIVDMNSFKRDQWIIWVGAGISHPSPTNLPLGMKLTEFSLEKTCGEDESHRIFSIWERAKKLINHQKDYSDFGFIPRLESILDVINEVEEKSTNTSFSFMKGFQSFLDAPSNSLHHNLAILLSQGAKIITANFDLCIENAYENLHCGNDKLIPDRFGTLTIFKSQKVRNTGEVWHYHGTADELSSLGATLKIIKDGLSNNVGIKLSELIAHSKILLFIGYSFSDAFDINPFFDNLPDRFFSDTKAIYYQHRSTNGNTPNTIAPPNIMKHLKCFKESQYDYGDTGDLLINLSGNNEVFNGSFDWEDAFIKDANLNDRDKIRPFMVCRMANFLGINTSKISHTAYKDAMSFQTCYPHDDFLDTMAVVLRKQGKFGLEKKQHLQKKYLRTGNLIEPDMLGYYYGIGDYKQASAYACKLNEISAEAASSHKVLNWRYYTSMAVYCRPIIQKYLVKIFKRNIESDDIQKLTSFLPILDSLGNRALKNPAYTKGLPVN